MKFIVKRLLNGFCLEYSLSEILRLVIVRKIICTLNFNRQIRIPSWISLDIDKINTFVISLEKRKDRRKRIDNQLSNYRLPFKYIDSIDGKKLQKENLTEYFTKNSLGSLTDGSIGCILSHIKAYELIVETKKPYTLIFEDDIKLSEDFRNSFNHELNSIPKDFDIIYLASNYSQKNNTLGWVSNTLYIPFYPRSGQYAYLISYNGAKKILKEIYPIKILLGGIDTIIGRLVTKNRLQAFHLSNNLCSVDYSFRSDIKNQQRR